MPAPSIKAAKPKDRPATRAMLVAVRDELKHDIRALDQKMDSKFKNVDAQFKNVDAQFKNVDAQLHELREQIHLMSSSMANMRLMAEEQHADNRIMYEALRGIVDRQEKVELRTDQTEQTVRGLARIRRQS